MVEDDSNYFGLGDWKDEVAHLLRWGESISVGGESLGRRPGFCFGHKFEVSIRHTDGNRYN